MSDKKTADCSEIAIDTVDKLNTTQNEIRFLSNMLLAWDVELFPPNANDLATMSRMCNQLDEQLQECKVLLKSLT
ncbi:MAG: hypothetical protein K0U47_06650 [Epsilonproteobacteria bacterium]|nr:hypothetical protein [Campylobacterota bacterium]